MLSKGITPHRQDISTENITLKLKMCVPQLHSNWGNIQVISKINFAVKKYAMLGEQVFLLRKIFH